MINIKEIKAEDTYEIRLSVLRKEIDLPYKFKEDFDESTFHLGAYHNNELVGVASFIKNKMEGFEEDQYQLRGMATVLKVRGKGYGKKIINESKNILGQKNTHILWCNARKEAVSFYEELTFNIVGAVFNVDKVGEHFKMFTKI
ncbi:GNAT family N-acetyltransferase [Tenacibaculum sp. HL-MS23]|uniref:GNAT family N-acetyltransferase n=1 Tax=Tenacibaculum sp. HL-MS23 TaxID=3077734 RepID=UPI0028FC1BB3|nr:GNAT family N-acetyltransferase [Tenacibaculum sp. HL-MS23]WNW02792.1 GNAT family N-acetyltransferase [Tenacibaculum sp. HL-MS23]